MYMGEYNHTVDAKGRLKRTIKVYAVRFYLQCVNCFPKQHRLMLKFHIVSFPYFSYYIISPNSAICSAISWGGHAYAVCTRLSDKGHFIGIDQDADAIAAAGKRLAEFQDKVTIIRNNYCNAGQALAELQTLFQLAGSAALPQYALQYSWQTVLHRIP